MAKKYSPIMICHLTLMVSIIVFSIVCAVLLPGGVFAGLGWGGTACWGKGTTVGMFDNH